MEKKRNRMVLLMVSACTLLTACNYSVTLAHTQGTATDLIDEDEKADPVISPTVSIPAKAL